MIMPGVECKLPEGWERSETTSGIPYYINHETEKTQWDHPAMIQLMHDLAELNNIKYAAYRTAMKLRAIHKKTQLYLVEIPILTATLDEEDVPDGYTEKALSIPEASKIITALFINQNGDRQDFIDIPMASDLTLNLMLNIYDPGRTGYIQALSLKIGISLLCAAKLQDKYRYLFRQMCNSRAVLDRKRLTLFLQECLQIPKYIYESTIFSGTSVEPAVKNCFETSCSMLNMATLDEFMEWMVAEPQTIVWLPTLHRLAVSETVKHEAKCNICKMYPIVGFRYRCLKCFNFDLCQGCFWAGRVSKGHKIGHPTQEYCLAPSQKEDIKDFAKVMRNKVSKKKKPTDPAKGRFIAIPNQDAGPASDDEFSVDGPSKSTKFSPDTHDMLCSYAARLADYEKTEASPPRGEPSHKHPRDHIKDEQDLIYHYANSLDLEPPKLPARQDTGDIVPDHALDQDQRDELEDLIGRLEIDNRVLRDEIDHIHELQQQSPDRTLALVPDFLDDSASAEQLRRRKERLVAREEILEAHNTQLQIQLSRLRALLYQDGTSPSNRPETSSAIKDQPTGHPLIRTHLSPTTPHQPTPLPDSIVIPCHTSSPRSRGDTSALWGEECALLDQERKGTPPEVRRVREFHVPFAESTNSVNLTQTSAAPTSSASTHIPPETIHFSFGNVTMPVFGQEGYLLNSQPIVSSPDPGYVNHSGYASQEEEELDRIVDRMTNAFPLDLESGVSMEVHNDLFVAASMVGEAMQSMVTAVSRQRGSGDSPGSYAQDITDDDTTLYSQNGHRR